MNPSSLKNLYDIKLFLRTPIAAAAILDFGVLGSAGIAPCAAVDETHKHIPDQQEKQHHSLHPSHDLCAWKSSVKYSYTYVYLYSISEFY